ncbi:MAG: RdgB/HAM1 family non-canonical purine NTP pyrophosphatase [Verrucomicrobiales bacterium]|jgi:XTP/dITP diphosphohydrolase|nr:RdgB/HAM1 family non-canonical purine NTP pyrophosphatase [Verrucomicrobiales bacterium]MBP9223560.1 RdgB/HAM1 family non-canonical purine NTP pyrophosphatase [Verrucomicrobiales bacterium]HQZ26801.1 RdgB/HAM1 family non-canonical purine NTP pyrophosphatase [Verrucomicrobiales bacterium]
MSRTLLIATHNAHKTAEMQAILGSFFDTITDLTSIPGMTPPVEDGSTFAENSEIKALAASVAMPEALVLADDSGLEVDALDGAPGIHSARYSGEEGTDASNREKLLSELALPRHAKAPRTARFRCVITLAKGGEVVAQFDGTVEGRIAVAMTGSKGFGYDPLFVPEGHEKSFGELSQSVKNEMSHRGNALAAFQGWLKDEANSI